MYIEFLKKVINSDVSEKHEIELSSVDVTMNSDVLVLQPF